jgi:hypothetical protein
MKTTLYALENRSKVLDAVKKGLLSLIPQPALQPVVNRYPNKREELLRSGRNDRNEN